MLSHYQELYYDKPQSEFERSVNSNLDDLCIAAQGCGWQAIQAQERLRTLKKLSKEERKAVYQVAIASLVGCQ